MRFKAGTVIAIVTLLLATGAEAAVSGKFRQALAQLDNGDYRRAYRTLEEMERGDSNFVAGLVELQKIHYRRQQWDKFFAYALYYRQGVAAGGKNALPLHARMISLEVMALAKHCYWDKGRQILQWARKRQSGLEAASRRELREAGEYLELHRQYPGREVSRRESREETSSPLFSTTQEWRIGEKQLAHIPHPRTLSLRLRSGCQ